jgi:hypothetical protein
MLGLKIISKNLKSFSRTTSLSLLGVWLVSLFGLVFLGIETGSNYANDVSVTEKHILNINQKDTLNIKMVAKDDFNLSRSYDNHKKVFYNDHEMIYSSDIRLDIKDSNDNTTYLKVYKKSSAVSGKKAKSKAQEIIYEYQLVDNNLVLNAYYLFEIKNRYSNQRVNLVLYLPKGKTIYLSESTKKFLSYVDNVQDLRDRDMPNHYYKMINKGLNCLDCELDSEKKELESKDITNENIDKTESKIDSVEVKIDSVKVKTTKINKHVKESKNGLEIN